MNDNDIDDKKSELIFRKKTKITLSKPVSECAWSELHDLRSRIQKELERLIENTEKDKRGITPEENVCFDYGNSLLNEITEEFNLRERLETKEPIDRKTPINPFRYGDTNLAGSTSKVNLRSYSGMFGNNLSNNGFADMREFFQVALSGRYDPRLEQRAGQMEGISSSGGYTVPTELAALIMNSALENEILRPRCRLFPMKSNSLVVPAWDADNHTDGNLYGGFSLVFLNEGGTATVQTAAVRQMTLTAHKIALYTQMTRELLDETKLNFQTGSRAQWSRQFQHR